MTTYDDHPGGVIVCDGAGCARKRRNHCSPEERDGWHSEVAGHFMRDFCPDHTPDKKPAIDLQMEPLRDRHHFFGGSMW